MRRNLLPSVEIEKEIEALLAGERVDVHPLEVVSELGKLGVRLVLQRAVEEEVDEWLGRARYERRAEAAPGKRNGYRPRRLQTGEGEIVVELPQVREACAPFTSRLFRRRKRFLASEPLQALVIGAFVRGLSMRDVESLCEEAGLGQVSRSTASRLCRELKERFRAFRERDLSGIHLVCLFLDAIYLPTRPSGAKEGVLCAWGISEAGERVLLEVSLGMRETEEDWTSLGRSLLRRGLPAPLLVVADGAPGLVNAIEQLWPHSDRQRCTVHRLRNVLAKLPERERERVTGAYAESLDGAYLRRSEVTAFLVPYKSLAASARYPVQRIGPHVNPHRIGGARFELREFYCPSCFGLLETEIARPADPVLDDAALSAAWLEEQGPKLEVGT